MTVSRADLVRLVLAGCLAVGTAQAESPIPAAAHFDPDTMERADPPTTERGSNVEINHLKAPNAESFGILDGANGGLGQNLWQGTSVRVVRALLPQLPAATGSQTMRQLERRLLLSSAIPPEGSVEGDRPSLLELRAERLMILGDLDGVLSLSSAAPASLSGPLLAKIKLDALLLSGNLPGACSEAKRQSASNGNDPIISKVSILCHFLGGNALQGNMGLELLRDRKDTDLPFIAAAEVVSGLPPLPPGKVALGELSPLHIAAYSAAKMPIPAPLIASASAAEARAVTLSAANSPDVRLQAAEKAEQAGALPVESLRKIYLEMPFSPQDLATALINAEAAGIRSKALLFRAAHDQSDPVQRAALVLKGLELAQAKGQLAAAARLFAPMLADIKPDPALTPHALLLARALILAGREGNSTPWLDLASQDPAYAKAIRALWPILTIARYQAGQPVALNAYQAWRDTLQDLPPEQVARRISLVLGCLSGLGGKIPDVAWLETLSLSAAGPKPGLFAMMQGAALDGRTGATLLAALVSLGEASLDKVDSLSLSESISALSVIGLTSEARHLALEALVQNGL